LEYWKIGILRFKRISPSFQYSTIPLSQSRFTVWNIGILERWNIGIECIVPIFHYSTSQSFSTDWITGILEYWKLSSKPSFQYSTIPIFHYSNLLRLPAAAERAVKLDDGVELIASGAREQQFLIEELLVGDQNFEVVRQPSVVTQPRQTGGFL
jgi:hypothetical protein